MLHKDTEMAVTLPRGFDNTEFENRTRQLQKMMADERLDAVLFTTEPNVRYYSGFSPSSGKVRLARGIWSFLPTANPLP